MWEALLVGGLLVMGGCCFIWLWHPANEPLANWRRQRERAKLIRERLR